MTKVKVTIQTERGEQAVEVEIDDQAAGFAAEHLNRALTDFLINPETRKPYEDEQEKYQNLRNLGQALHSASRPKK